jgi:hypothetical protein
MVQYVKPILDIETKPMALNGKFGNQFLFITLFTGIYYVYFVQAMWKNYVLIDAKLKPVCTYAICYALPSDSMAYGANILCCHLLASTKLLSYYDVNSNM